MHTSEYLGLGKDVSGSITAGTTAQELAPANGYRRHLTIQNISSGDLWVNPHGDAAAVDTSGSYKIVTMGFFSVLTMQPVSIIGATTGQKFTATEV